MRTPQTIALIAVTRKGVQKASPERAGWRQLWTDVAALLKKTEDEK
jgi:hypothetical protein